jgi:dynein heavy chain
LLQGHYDFGTRALKAVLMMAGALKRASTQEPEDAVMVRALQDANLPKLLTEVRGRGCWQLLADYEVGASALSVLHMRPCVPVFAHVGCGVVSLACSQDIVLFKALITDLFPNTQLPQPSNTQLDAALLEACVAAGLQPEPAFTDKALQLHDTLGVRFGVMLVGPAGECSARTV